MRFVSLFAGIGGFDLGLERAGWTCVAQVEIDPFCRDVLALHWPHVKRFADVRDVHDADLPAAEAIVGGFPCQDISNAGKRGGLDGGRSSLWTEARRLIQEVRPRWAVIENSSHGRRHWLCRALRELQDDGYHAVPLEAAAHDVGAPHIRRRVFLVAHACPGRCSLEEATLQAGRAITELLPRWDAEPGVRRVADGIPHRVDRLKALGNAVVPQVAEVIGRAILAAESGASTDRSKK